MADIAMLLHWTPDVMHGMELAELMHWRQLAVERHNALHAAPDTD
ncbi:MAG: GpE family phage tail protein [Proteobacteria bacterium]|nr:GpE family phage tail protein [Pseudomonadota bacterium]